MNEETEVTEEIEGTGGIRLGLAALVVHGCCVFPLDCVVRSASRLGAILENGENEETRLSRAALFCFRLLDICS